MLLKRAGEADDPRLVLEDSLQTPVEKPIDARTGPQNLLHDAVRNARHRPLPRRSPDQDVVDIAPFILARDIEQRSIEDPLAGQVLE